MKSLFDLAWVLSFLASTSGFGVAFVVEPEKPLLQEFAEKQPFNLRVENSNGPFSLAASRNGKISLKATTRYKESFTIDVTGFGSEQAVIKVKYPEKKQAPVIHIGPGEIPPSRSVQLELSVPVELLLDLSVETKTGDILLMDGFETEYAMARVLKATSQNGGIAVREFSSWGGGELKTTNGSVKLQKLNGSLLLTTSNGNIEVEGGEGNVSAVSKNGGIRVVNRTGDSVEAGAVNGNIFFNNPKVKKENAASSGNITYTRLDSN